MLRVRPTIEPLDARTLPSAMVALPADPAADVPAQVADDSGEPATAEATGKVTMQDFHFVMKVNKASPKL